MENGLGRKLALHADLAPEDLAALARLSAGPRRRLERGSFLVLEGEPKPTVPLLLDGWACRYKQLPDGRRQIVSVLLPGDMGDPDLGLLPSVDHSVGLLTTATVTEIDPRKVEDVCQAHPRIMRALRVSALADLAIQREWVLNLGQRDAAERLGHLLCELHFRQDALGLARNGCFPMPLTQSDLAEALGITNVHVNRTLQSMRKSGVLDIKGKQVVVTDMAGLAEASLFDPSYLQHAKRGKAGQARHAGPSPGMSLQ